MTQMEKRVYESGVDLPELLARVEYDRALLREVFDIFLEEFPVLNLELQLALQRGDLNRVRITAHTLKGMLASLSFGRAAACAMRIERMAAQAFPDGIREELVRLERNAALAQEDLASACDEVIR